jgi:hypothetical protein
METVFGPAISTYSRQQAIEDGVLVDLMQHPTPQQPELDDLQKIVREAGFIIPVAMTVAAFEAAIMPIGGELPAGQDFNGRLWDVLTVLRFAMRQHRKLFEPINFTVSVFDGQKGNDVALTATVGPGDNAEPVITIMLPTED